jgi:Holliday junction resolvase-like predicted endonuclease
MQRGIEAENLVRDYYLKRGYKMLHQRFRSKLAEIDLLFLDSEGRIVIVEVKSWTKEEFLNYRLSYKQKNRIQRVIESMSEMYGEVYAHLAIVSQRNEISIFEDVFG